MTPDRFAANLDAIQRRTDELTSAAGARSDDDLALPSALEGWSRLTILCHLRYGATMTARMTRATVNRQPTAFYPEGRELQRPQTLRPAPGESARQVIASLAEQSGQLAYVWAGIWEDEWDRPVLDGNDGVRLPRMALTIGDLALLRFTEVEVHGTDLGIGLCDWSTEFVEVTLPRRVAWLGRRTAPHLSAAVDLPMTWLLASTDGPSYSVRIGQEGETTTEIAPFAATAQHRIEGSSRELLATILGRRAARDRDADDAAISSFRQTFPGP
ncbi:MAG: maleylpyruvate isomerase N-terminal domain-containing protein [Acidimicrobiales bacterium]